MVDRKEVIKVVEVKDWEEVEVEKVVVMEEYLEGIKVVQ